jgi:hypothetical protein
VSNKISSVTDQIVSLYLDTHSEIPKITKNEIAEVPEQILICSKLSDNAFNGMPKNLELTLFQSGKDPKIVEYVNLEYNKTKNEVFNETSEKKLNIKISKHFQGHILPFIKFIVRHNLKSFNEHFQKSIVFKELKHTDELCIGTIQHNDSDYLRIYIERNEKKLMEIPVNLFMDWVDTLNFYEQIQTIIQE